MTNQHDNAFKPQLGTWTLTAPDGRAWQGESPIHCVAKERKERVPVSVQYERLIRDGNCKIYPCGCSAAPINVPDYCPTHGSYND